MSEGLIQAFPIQIEEQTQTWLVFISQIVGIFPPRQCIAIHTDMDLHYQANIMCKGGD